MASAPRRITKVASARTDRPRTLSYLAIAVFAGLALSINLFWPVPVWVPAVYLVASVTAFITYAVDKSAARVHRRRVSERNLLLLGMLGGWPGAIMAQQLLRHKTQKVSFRRAFWGTVAVNVMVFLALTTGT
ncbi:DUF1294 domain-containing protein [Cryobacterium sp. CG_9.6]|uniref:DUF1294 domain-containing protein n=1 Tax=Cryobacterium sp. CG_9.6 TaxID=2760710 RepID=UPI00247724A1|nr:DUF1294 domain-containing protein [Cryobacterium sp. CG_9.6]MDH6237706.1 uncharacterized membrane protein YsdA (DUF1294 family) [Cryobacterium sp. CG_9.6]